MLLVGSGASGRLKVAKMMSCMILPDDPDELYDGTICLLFEQPPGSMNTGANGFADCIAEVYATTPITNVESVKQLCLESDTFACGPTEVGGGNQADPEARTRE